MTAVDQERQIMQSMEAVAEKAAAKAVRETLILFGVDVKDPIKAQEQFAALRQLANKETISDLEFLRRWHSAADRVSDTGWRTFTKILITALLGLFAIVTKDYWLSHIWK